MKPIPLSSSLSVLLGVSLLVGGCGKPSKPRAVSTQSAAATPEPQLSARDIGLRFDIARGAIGGRRYTDAAVQLERLTRQKAATQPLLNWISLHQGLALMLAGQDEDARKLFTEIGERNWSEEGPGAEKLAKFFQTVTKNLSSAEKIDSAVSRDYDKSTYEAFALLLYGLKNWNMGDYDSASSLFRQFSSAYMKAPEQWLGPIEDINRLKELVDHFEDAVSENERVNKELDRAKTPEDKKIAIDDARKARPKIQVLGKLTRALDARIAEIEPEALAALAEMERSANADMDFDAKALPAAKEKRAALLASMRFEEARQAILAPDLRTEKPREEQQLLATKTQWLASFKGSLIEDINKSGGFPGAVSRKSGPPLTGAVVKADEQGVYLKGTPAPVPWTELAPESIRTMALSFITEDIAPLLVAHRKWHLGVYSMFIGKSAEAKTLTAEAAKLNSVFEEALPLLLQPAD